MAVPNGFHGKKSIYFSLLGFIFLINAGGAGYGEVKEMDAKSSLDLVFVQVPVQAEPTHIFTHDNTISLPTDRYVDGCRIVSYSPSAPQNEPVNLTPNFLSACDPAISFDGKTILFAGKKQTGDSWQIWRMDRDGTNPVQVTHHQNDCVSPLYVGTLFFLNDPAPTEQIVFVGLSKDWVNENGHGSASSLYGCDLEGKNIHRITFNLNNDFSPEVLPNGRIIFSSWQGVGTRFASSGLLTIMAVSNDGTDLLPYYGNQEQPLLKEMARAADTERVYFIEAYQNTWLGGGDLAYISMHRPLHSYRKLAEGGTGFYHSPCPLPGGGLLVSYRENKPKSALSIYRIDPETGKRLEVVYSSKDWHCIDTHALAPHSPVHGRSSVVDFEKKTGIFYCLNSYITDDTKGNSIIPGSIKRLRVIEGIPLRKGQSLSQFSATAFGPRRLLGEIPVEADGSFQVEVPAQIPLTFQVLNENGIALYSQNSWTWVMPKENRGCIGCHEDAELTPPNRLAEALKKPAHQLTLPPEKRRTVDFRNSISPILQAKCSGSECHSAGGKPPNLDTAKMIQWKNNNTEYSQAYISLLFSDEGKIPYVIPGEAKNNRLIQHILKKNTISEPKSACMPPKRALSLIDRIQLIEWADLGAQWDCETETNSSATLPTGK